MTDYAEQIFVPGTVVVDAGPQVTMGTLGPIYPPPGSVRMVEQVVEPDIMVGAFDPRATVQVDALALRKWCVEQALRWPEPSRGVGLSGYNPMTSPEIDILAKAQRIFDWVAKAP